MGRTRVRVDVRERQRDDALSRLGAQRRDARRTRLVAEQSVEPFLEETLLPAPNAGLDFPVRLMTAFVPTPSAVNSTISARQTCFCGVLRS
jgi:hypothetical protein